MASARWAATAHSHGLRSFAAGGWGGFLAKSLVPVFAFQRSPTPPGAVLYQTKPSPLSPENPNPDYAPRPSSPGSVGGSRATELRWMEMLSTAHVLIDLGGASPRVAVDPGGQKNRVETGHVLLAWDVAKELSMCAPNPIGSEFHELRA